MTLQRQLPTNAYLCCKWNSVSGLKSTLANQAISEEASHCSPQKTTQMSYDDDYGDGDYDMDYDETRQYVRKVKDQLKGVKVTDAQIIRKLEETDYDIKKTVNQLKPKDSKPGAALKTSGLKAMGVPTAGKSTKASLTTTQIPLAAAAAPFATDKDQKPTVSGTVFHEVETHSGKGDVALSDDEDVLTSTVGGESIHRGDGASAPDQNNTPLSSLTMVVTGHVDAGKSTLVGHLLYKCGAVAQRTIHKYEKDSQNIGKASFAFAWVTDESQAERERGVTIDVAER
jgi:hypothetical protein